MAARLTRDSRNGDGANPIELQGFNNLTKSLSFNLYDICYAARPQSVREYIDYIDEAYNAERLTSILTEVTRILDAEILNVARHDYHPQGASVTMLIAEEPTGLHSQCGVPESVVAHLDKSHICVHTYPESHPDNGICTFRADIDVGTCGQISPLRALDFLLTSFESDIVHVDYRVRGFTRDRDGTKHFIDHEIESIQEFIDDDILRRYSACDVNVPDENLFHTKLLLEDFELDNYLFGDGIDAFRPDELHGIESAVRSEMTEIFAGRPRRQERK